MGSSYKIPGVGAITVRDYAGSAITVEEMADIGATITIDQAKYFAFNADYVDSAEAAYNVLPAYIDQASYGLANAVDAYVASTLVSSGSAQQITGGTLDVTTVLDWFADVQKKFDTQNVPAQGRWVAVPASVTSLLLKANLTKNMAGADISNGSIANVFGIDVYMSNNLKQGATSASCWAVGGVQNAADLILTLRDVESVVSPTRFATVERGLVVYGAGVRNWGAIINSDITK
jgi:hypothetical protein